MNKLQVQKRVFKNSEPLDLEDFDWDEHTKTFSTQSSNLLLDFSTDDESSDGTGQCFTFYTGDSCKFYVWSDCTFITGNYCTFLTGNSCKFLTGQKCVIIRQDIYDIIEIPKNEPIKLNWYRQRGYKIIKKEDIEKTNIQRNKRLEAYICEMEKLLKTMKLL